jgi:acetyl esterase/lipase
MRKQESGKSNLELLALRVTGATSISRKHRNSLIALSLIAACSLTAASAQETNNSKPEQAPTPATVLNLWPGVAPRSEQWKQPETALGPDRIVNVSTPTLTAYLPDPSTATGTAVIIAPGGGFVWLSINSEGHDVAKWLVTRGIAAFVLKYRLLQVEGQEAAQLGQSANAALGAVIRTRSLVDEYGKYGIADGIQAVKILRAHGAKWGISPERIVFTGFSAGAILTSAVVLQPDARPNYAALIYGGPFNEVPPIPQGLPPIFLAVAQDDAGAGPLVTRFYDALKAAGYKPELHLFSAGGHGFGMRKQGTSSDHWIDEFYYWLEAQGLTRPLK